MKKCKTYSLLQCFWAYYKCDICFSYKSIFIHIDCHHLLYLTVRICRAIFMTIFSLTAIKTFIFYEMSFSFIWSDRDILCANNVDIHEIVCRNKQIQKCENDRLKILLNIWLLISWSLIETKIFINLLI